MALINKSNHGVLCQVKSWWIIVSIVLTMLSRRLCLLCHHGHSNFKSRIWRIVTYTLIARFMGPTWGPCGDDITQVGPMLAPWTLLCSYIHHPWLLLMRFFFFYKYHNALKRRHVMPRWLWWSRYRMISIEYVSDILHHSHFCASYSPYENGDLSYNWGNKSTMIMT